MWESLNWTCFKLVQMGRGSVTGFSRQPSSIVSTDIMLVMCIYITKD